MDDQNNGISARELERLWDSINGIDDKLDQILQNRPWHAAINSATEVIGKTQLDVTRLIESSRSYNRRLDLLDGQNGHVERLEMRLTALEREQTSTGGERKIVMVMIAFGSQIIGSLITAAVIYYMLPHGH